jgi:hypothetical protein
MTPLPFVKPGDPFKDTANPWNRFIAATHAHLPRAYGSEVDSKNLDPPVVCVTAENSTAADRRPGDVVEINKTSRVLTAPLDNYSIWLKAVTPDGTRGYGIVREHFPLNSLEKDIVQVAGVCVAHVNVTDTNHRTAAISGSSHVLVSSQNGPVFLLYAPTATGEQQCVVCVNQPMQVFLGQAQLTADMCPGSDAAITGFVGMKFGQYTIPPSPLPTIGSNANRYCHAGQAGDRVLLLYNDNPATSQGVEIESRWMVIDVQKKEQYLITDSEVNWVTCCFRKKRRKCAIEACEPESAWIENCQ